MEPNKDMQEFLAMLDSNVVSKAEQETKNEMIRKKMLITTYNESLQQNFRREIEFNFEDKITVEDKIKMKNTGWKISDIDIKAIEDFIYGRSTSMQEVLKYALRLYIPQEIYEDILEREEKSKGKMYDIGSTKLNELKDKYIDLENYYAIIEYKSSYNNNQFNNIPVNLPGKYLISTTWQ